MDSGDGYDFNMPYLSIEYQAEIVGPFLRICAVSVIQLDKPGNNKDTNDKSKFKIEKNCL